MIDEVKCIKRLLIVIALILLLRKNKNVTMVTGAIDCATIITLLSSCSDFVQYGGADPDLGSPCCNGILSLYNITVDSVDNRRSSCSCIMALVSTYNPNATAVARLPGLCGVSLGFPIDPSVNCYIIP